jgi:hypothetical protein
MEISLMAIYPVYNPETGEKKVIEMSVHDIMDWYENNKPWSRDWSQGCATPGEVGEWKDKLVARNPGWNEVLEKSSRAPGSRVKKI